MRAHAHDLRAEVARDFAIEDETRADAFVHHIATRWRDAEGLRPSDYALCRFAEKLTLTPKEMNRSDLQALRAAGLGDEAIHDATQIISYFNYINRVADALGVEPEDFIRAWEQAPEG